MDIQFKCIMKILNKSWCSLRNKLTAISLLFNYHCNRNVMISLNGGHHGLCLTNGLVSCYHYGNMSIDFFKQHPLHPVLCATSSMIKGNLFFFHLATAEDLKKKKKISYQVSLQNKTLQKSRETFQTQKAEREWVYIENREVFSITVVIY